MTKITFIDAAGQQIEAQAAPGQTLMQLAVDSGVAGIVAECGGACACGTCHCYIDENWGAKLKPAEGNELDMLEFVIDPTPQSRLGCQVVLTPDLDGLIVNVPATQT